MRFGTSFTAFHRFSPLNFVLCGKNAHSTTESSSGQVLLVFLATLISPVFSETDFFPLPKELDGVVPLMTDPPSTNFTSFSKKSRIRVTLGPLVRV